MREEKRKEEEREGDRKFFILMYNAKKSREIVKIAKKGKNHHRSGNVVRPRKA